MLNRERSVKMNFNHTYFLTTGIEEINCFLNCIAYRTHSNNNSVCIFCTIIIEKLIICAKLFVYHIHIHFSCCNCVIIILVTSLSVLEENIAVFCRTAKNRPFRIKRPCTKCLHIIHINH